MSIRNPVYRETAAIAVGEVLCVGLMLGVYALAGQLDRAAVLGGVLGGVLAICNFFFMAVGASLAADRAEQRECEGRDGPGADVLPAAVSGAVPDFVCCSEKRAIPGAGFGFAAGVCPSHSDAGRVFPKVG